MKSDDLKDSTTIFPSKDSEFDAEIEADLRHILAEENLESRRNFIQSLALKLNVDVLDCSSALLFCYHRKIAANPVTGARTDPISGRIKTPEIRMVRYRIEVGRKHGITADNLCKILIAESGVDKNNIVNIDIQATCTYIELPDEMPQDIFLHLKSIQVNEQKLDIKRIKNRNGKKRPRSRSRHKHQRQSRTSGQGQNAG